MRDARQSGCLLPTKSIFENIIQAGRFVLIPVFVFQHHCLEICRSIGIRKTGVDVTSHVQHMRIMYKNMEFVQPLQLHGQTHDELMQSYDVGTQREQ